MRVKRQFSVRSSEPLGCTQLYLTSGLLPRGPSLAWVSAGLREKRVDAINTFRVSAGHFRRFAYFRVVRFDVSAAKLDFVAGFDSRQLH